MQQKAFFNLKKKKKKGPVLIKTASDEYDTFASAVLLNRDNSRVLS